MRDGDGSFGWWMWVLRAALVGALAALVVARAATGGLALEPLLRLAPSLLPAGLVGGALSGATGTSAGFVYVPVLDLLREAGLLRIAFHQNVSGAAVVQAFGTGMAAIGWLAQFYGARAPAGGRIADGDLIAIVFATLCAAVPTLVFTELGAAVGDRTLQTAFVIFALALGGTLLVFSWAFRRVEPSRERPERFDLGMLMLIGVVGGYVASFFAVGLGEFLVIYLVFRKFPVRAAIAAAVVAAAVTGAVKAGFEIAEGRIAWEAVLVAAPGALVGGLLAGALARLARPFWLETGVALWIVGASLYMIVRALA